MSNKTIEHKDFLHMVPEDMADWRLRWPNFHPRELACYHCRKLKVDPFALDCLQKVRRLYDQPITLTSAYRCEKHNLAVGGASRSAHLYGSAFDLKKQSGADLHRLLTAIWHIEPLGFGMGGNKLHIDWDYSLGQRAWAY